MKITFLRDKIRTDEGGASWSLHLMAQRLVERGYDVEVVTIHHSKLSNKLPEAPNYTLTEKPIDNRTQIDGAYQIYKILDEIDTPDVLHSFEPELHPIVAAWKRKNPDVPIVGRLNTYRNFCTNVATIADGCYNNCTLRRKWTHHPHPSIGTIPKMAFDTFVQPSLLNRFDRFHAQSPAVKRIFRGFGIGTELISVIPNFYDERLGRPLAPGVVKNPDGPARLLTVGRISHEKGLQILLEALNSLESEVEVDIIGDGPELKVLKQHAPQNVTFHGWIDHSGLSTYYAGGEIYVHPGLWPDPCPRSLIEAMQFCCLPVVSDTGGPPWMIGQVGEVFPRGDSKALTECIESALGNCYEKSAYEENLTRFSPNRIISQIEETYQQVGNVK